MDGCLYLFTFTCAQYAYQLMLCAVLLRSRRFHDFTLHVSFIYIKKLFELHHRYHNAIIFIPVRISLAQFLNCVIELHISLPCHQLTQAILLISALLLFTGVTVVPKKNCRKNWSTAQMMKERKTNLETGKMLWMN